MVDVGKLLLLSLLYFVMTLRAGLLDISKSWDLMGKQCSVLAQHQQVTTYMYMCRETRLLHWGGWLPVTFRLYTQTNRQAVSIMTAEHKSASDHIIITRAL